MSIVGGVIGAIAAILQFILGEPVAFVMLFICIVSIFQFKLYSKPFIEIQENILTARLTLIITKTIDLSTVTKIETPKNKKIILYPKEGKKLILPLNSQIGTETDIIPVLPQTIIQ